MPTDYKTIVANITGHKVLRDGAKVTVAQLNPGWANDRVFVYALNRRGRKVKIMIASADLTNPRLATIPDQHPMHGKAAECTAIDLYTIAAWSSMPKKRWRDLNPQQRDDFSNKVEAEWSRNEPLPTDTTEGE